MEPSDIGHVHAHATSTPGGDLAEADAVAKALGTHPVVTATKSMTGHMLGASGRSARCPPSSPSITG